MTDQQDPRHQQYERVRDAFDGLKTEDKALFLIKETVNTVVQGIEEAVQSVVNEFESMFGEAPAAGTETEKRAAAGNGAAKTGAPRKKAPPTKGKSTPGKTAKKKPTTSKRTTASTKTPPKKDDGAAT